MSFGLEAVEPVERRSLFDPERVTITLRTTWIDGICIPDSEGESKETAVFSVLTYGDNHAIEKESTYEIVLGKRPSGQDQKANVIDINVYQEMLVRRCLMSWTLDIPIVKDVSGWMTNECYDKVSSIPAPLMDAFVTKFREASEVSDEEEQIILRQCASLFSPNSVGITDACDAVSKFCTLGNFSEKFGMDSASVNRMSMRDYLMLKMIMSKEGDSHRSRTRSPNAGANAQIVGKGGRSRPSRATRIPMPGST